MGKVKLVLDKHNYELECSECGDTFLSPYFQGIVTCSRCFFEGAERRKQERLAIAFSLNSSLPAPVCECGFMLDKCHVATCLGPKPPAPKKPKQSSLF